MPRIEERPQAALNLTACGAFSHSLGQERTLRGRMWHRADVVDGCSYQVALCQDKRGHRSFVLHQVGSTQLPPDAVFLTAIVPADLLLQGNMRRIAELVPSQTAKVWVDAHNVWLTSEEVEALEDDREVPWLNGLAANLAPK